MDSDYMMVDGNWRNEFLSQHFLNVGYFNKNEESFVKYEENVFGKFKFFKEFICKYIVLISLKTETKIMMKKCQKFR